MHLYPLWNKNFTLVVIRQIISLSGSAILRFTLPLYPLDLTGSSSIYGAVLACSTIPVIVFSPVGGILTNRVNKHNIMVFLDFFTTVVIPVFSIYSGGISDAILILSIMIILYAIQGTYQPTVQSSIPSLVNREYLLGANAIISQVNSFSGILRPVIGGFLYGVWGLPPIPLIAGIFFFSSAVLELFIRIPYLPKKSDDSILTFVIADFRESIQFVRHGKPVVWNVMCIVAVFDLFLTSMLLVGVLVLIIQILNLSNRLYGYTQGALMTGGTIGGAVVGIYGGRIKLHQSHLLLFGAALAILPIGVILFLDAPAAICYIAVSVCAFVFMMISAIFSIRMLAFIQKETPSRLIGKVIFCVLIMSPCAQPVGNAMYGLLFEWYATMPWVVVLGVLGISILVPVLSKKVFLTMK